jgi:hypothetical protein
MGGEGRRRGGSNINQVSFCTQVRYGIVSTSDHPSLLDNTKPIRRSVTMNTSISPNHEIGLCHACVIFNNLAEDIYIYSVNISVSTTLNHELSPLISLFGKGGAYMYRIRLEQCKRKTLNGTANANEMEPMNGRF